MGQSDLIVSAALLSLTHPCRRIPICTGKIVDLSEHGKILLVRRLLVSFPSVLVTEKHRPLFYDLMGLIQRLVIIHLKSIRTILFFQ